MGSARPGKGLVDALVRKHVAAAENGTGFRGRLVTRLRIEIEDCDPGSRRTQRLHRRQAKA